MAISIGELIRRADDYLIRSGYADSSASMYRQTWRWFEEWCRSEVGSAPTRADAVRYITSKGWDDGADYLQRQRKRCVLCLFDLEATGRFPRRYCRPAIEVPERFASVMEGYAAHLAQTGIKGRTIGSRLSKLRHFLRFLGERGVADVGSLGTADVHAYVESIAGEATSTRSGRIYSLRAFLAWAVGSLGCDPALARLFPKVIMRRDDALPSVYSGEEVREVIGAVMSAEGPCRLRDRALFLLAFQEAMRAGDIRGLMLSDIDWRAGSVSFVQQKTAERVTLPLAEESLLALADYIRNERPPCDDPRVFVVAQAPYGPYGDAVSFSASATAHFRAAGVDVGERHHGLHAMRHSAAVAMLASGSDYPTVSGVLGHASADTTKRYLRVDSEALRPLCLEVPHA